MPSKQVIIVRKDIKMRRAAFAATVARASTEFLLDCNEFNTNGESRLKLTSEESSWLFGNSKRIVLGVNSEEALKRIMARADAHGLTVCPQYQMKSEEKEYEDCGQLVCVAIGPHEESAIDEITNNLKLI